MLDRRNLARVTRFGAVGVFNTALDFALLFTLVYLAHINPFISNGISTGICLVVSFFLNKKWTFRARGNSRRQFIAFLVVTLTGLWGLQTLIIWLVNVLLPQAASLAAPTVLAVAKVFATGGSLLWNYLLYSRLVFRATEVTAPEAHTP